MILLKKKKLFKNSLIYSVMNTLAKRKEKLYQYSLADLFMATAFLTLWSALFQY